MNIICQAVAYAGVYECDLVPDASIAIEQKFAEHISNHGLSYGTQEEYSFRLDQFAKTDAKLNEINSNPENTYSVAHNKFSTMTEYELNRFRGELPSEIGEDERVTELPTDNLSASIDWRAKGAVNHVQD